jgi:7-cyano-7-deazaguanine synthase
MHTTALVLFSGGQDSTTCLAQALSKYQRVETIAFDYRQRHSVELQARLKVLSEIRTQFPPWADRLGEDHLLDLAVLGQVSETSLTRDTAFKMEASGLPNTFVPGRNLLFLTWRPHWPTGATCRSSLPACARPTSRVTRTVATTP